MKYVKCVYDGGATIRLTIGKIYEVKLYTEFPNQYTVDEYSPIIEIEDNVGDLVSYSIYSKFGNDITPWFIDATPDIREEKINSILS